MDGRPPRIASAGAVRRPLMGSMPTVNRPAGPTLTSAASASAVGGGGGEAPPLRTNADGVSDGGARQQPANARPQSSPAGRRSLPGGRIAALRAARDSGSGGSSPMHQPRPQVPSSPPAASTPSGQSIGAAPPARPSSANAAQLRATLEDLQSAVVAMRDVHDVLFQRLGSDTSGSFHEHDDSGPNHPGDQELPNGVTGAVGGDSGQPELRRPGQPIRARPGTAPPRLPGRVAAPGQATSFENDPDVDGASTSEPSMNGRVGAGASPASTVTTTNDALRATLQLREEILNDIRRIRETASAHDAARRRRRGQPPADLDHHPDMNDNGGGNRGMQFGDQEYEHGGDVHTRYVVGEDGQLYELEGDDDSETEYAEEPQAPPPASEAAIAGLTPVVIPPPATIANADNDTTASPPRVVNTANVPTTNVLETSSPSTLHATAVGDQKKVSPPRKSPRGGHAKHQERPVSHAPVCAICHDVAGSTSPDILSHVCGAAAAATAATSTAVFNDVEPVDLVPPRGPETPSSFSSAIPAIAATTEHVGVDGREPQQHTQEQEQEQEQQRSGHAVMINECGHIFCFACIALWLRRTNSCPTCRATVETPRRPRAPVDFTAPAPPLPTACSEAAPGTSALEEHVVQQRTDDDSHVVEAGSGAGPPEATQPSSDARTADHASARDLPSSVSPPVVAVTIAGSNTETTSAGQCGDEERANASSCVSGEATDEGPTNRGSQFETTPRVVAPTTGEARSEVAAPLAELTSEVTVGPRGLLQRRRENNNAATSTTASITIDQEDSAVEVDESDPVVGESAPSANNEKDVEATHDAPPARETTSVFSATVDAAAANAIPSFTLPQPRGVPPPVQNDGETSLLPTDVSSSDASPASSLRVGASILRPSSCGPSFRGVVESSGHGGSSSALCSPKSSEHSVTFTGPDAKGDAPHRRCRHSAPAVGVHARLAGTGRLRLSSLSSDQHGGTKGRHSQHSGGAGGSGSGRGLNSRASNHQRRSDPLTMDDEDDYDYDHGESSTRVRSVGRGVSQPSPSKYLQDPKILIERRMRDSIAKEKVVVQQKAEHASAFLQELHQRQQGRGSVHTAATVASPATMGRGSVSQPDGHQHASPGLRRALSAAGPIAATKSGRTNRSVSGPGGGRSLSNAGPRAGTETPHQSEHRNGAPVSFLASIATYDIRNPVGSSAYDTPAPVYHHATSSSYSRPATANQQVSSGGDPRPRSSPLMPRATSAGAQRPLNNPRSSTAPQQSSGSGGTAQETSAHSRHHTIVSKGRGVFAQGQGVQGRAHVGSVRAASAGRLQRGTAARTAAVLQSQLLAAQEAEASSQVVQEIGAILQNVRDITEDSLRRQEHHITSPSSKVPQRQQEHLPAGDDPGSRALKQQRGGGAPPPLHEQKAVVSGHVTRAVRTAVLGPAVPTRSRQYR